MNIRFHIREALSDSPLKAVEKDLDKFDIDEAIINEVSPPGLEHVVKKLKRVYKKKGLENWLQAAYATAWKMYNEKK